MKITWLGHDSFMIQSGGRVVYIDPFVLPRGARLADMILVTHEHFDHCDPAKINEIRHERTIVVCPNSCRGKIKGDVVVMDPGSRRSFPFASVEAVHAYNTNKPFHPRGLGLGYVLEMEGKRLYHAGDTDYIPEMADLKNIKVALLPISGVYVMNMTEAQKAVETIKPEIVIPMHYNFLENLKADPRVFKDMIPGKGRTRVEILDGGKSLEV